MHRRLYSARTCAEPVPAGTRKHGGPLIGGLGHRVVSRGDGELPEGRVQRGQGDGAVALELQQQRFDQGYPCAACRRASASSRSAP